MVARAAAAVERASQQVQRLEGEVAAGKAAAAACSTALEAQDKALGLVKQVRGRGRWLLLRGQSCCAA